MECAFFLCSLNIVTNYRWQVSWGNCIYLCINLYCLLKERPYLEISLSQKLFFWKCTHFHLICIKCMHFQWKFTNIPDFNEKCHLASKVWWEQWEGYYLVWENRQVYIFLTSTYLKYYYSFYILYPIDSFQGHMTWCLHCVAKLLLSRPFDQIYHCVHSWLLSKPYELIFVLCTKLILSRPFNLILSFCTQLTPFKTIWPDFCIV